MQVVHDSTGGGIFSWESARAAQEQQRQAELAASGSNTLGPPVQFLDDSDNIYKDADGVIRNMRQDAGNAAVAQPGRSERGGSKYDYDAYYGGGSMYGAGTSSGYGPNTGPQNSWTQYGPNAGPQQGGGGDEGGGGRMPTQQTGAGTVRTQWANLNPNVYGQPIDTSGITSSAGAAGGYAAGLSGINPTTPYAGAAGGNAGTLQGMQPQVPGAPRTLYNQYQSTLMNPGNFVNNPVVQAALAQAQKAAGRKLAASRISKSGNAAQAISDTTSQTLMGQYYNLAGLYGEGAQLEGSRYKDEQGLRLEASRQGGENVYRAGQLNLGAGNLEMDAVKARIAALSGAGDLAVRSGSLQQGAGDLELRRQQMELGRVEKGIVSPEEAYRQQQAGIDKYNAGANQQPLIPSMFGADRGYATQPNLPTYNTWAQGNYWAQ